MACHEDVTWAVPCMVNCIENSLIRGKDCICNLTEHTRLTIYSHQYIQQKCKMNHSLKMCLLYHTLHTEEENNDSESSYQNIQGYA